ncbi:MAG TPA: hypothetical protein VGE67_05150, partial [Haloferula sp.]
NPLDVLGPRDKPALVPGEWSQIEVTYWVFTTSREKEIQRSFTIKDSAAIDRIKSGIKVSKVDGLSIGTGRQLVLKGAKGEVWHGDVVFEDTLYLSLSADGWRSYKFELSGSELYDELRAACAKNERRYHPKATPGHIKLRSNLAFDYPRL